VKTKLQNCCGLGFYLVIFIGSVFDMLWLFGFGDNYFEYAADAYLVGGIFFAFHFFYLRPSPWFPQFDKKEQKVSSD